MKDQLLQLRAECNLTDRDVIGGLFQFMDEGKDFVSGSDNYVWFYLIGKLVRPRVIAELGSRFGYSMKCFVEGAGHPPEEMVVRAFDAECDGIKTLHVFEDYFRKALRIQNIKITKADTQSLKTLWMDGQADLCMVDGMHTVKGCLHECRLAWEALKPGGVMVIDDLDNQMVVDGFHRFCSEVGAKYEMIPSLRIIAVVFKS